MKKLILALLCIFLLLSCFGENSVTETVEIRPEFKGLNEGLILTHDSDIPNNEREVVVIFHGWSGFVSDVEDLANALYKNGKDVFVPYLPGHGTNHQDFLQSTHTDWIRFAEKFVASVVHEKGYSKEKLSVCGLSMGALLGIIAGEKNDVENYVLLAPAFEARDWLINLSGVIGMFSPYFGEVPDTSAITDFQDYLVAEYKSVTWVKPSWELLQVMNKAKESVTKLKSLENMKVIFSYNDSMVNKYNSLGVLDNALAGFAASGVSHLQMFETTEYRRGEHEITLFEAGDEVISETIAFLDKMNRIDLEH